MPHLFRDLQGRPRKQMSLPQAEGVKDRRLPDLPLLVFGGGAPDLPDWSISPSASSRRLKEYALVVSGSSGCNKWKEHPAAGTEAKAYAEQK